MAQIGYTPIQLYRTSTASAAPTSGNLSAGELAINLLDEKLYFKNNAGVVKLLAANVTPVANGGTALTATPANGQLPIGNGSGYTLATLSAGSGISISNTSGGITITSTVTPGSGTVTSVGGTGSINGLTLTGTVTSSGNLTLGGTFRFNSSSISGNTAASANTIYVASASLTLTLPASPSAGDIVGYVNMSGTTTATISRNGNNIMALAQDLTVDVNNTGFILMYSDATQGWVLLP
jgi:hypothetical protein